MATEAPVDDGYTVVDERPAGEQHASEDKDTADDTEIFEGGDDFDEDADFHCTTPGIVKIVVAFKMSDQGQST
jgi:hypothetical protein